MDYECEKKFDKHNYFKLEWKRISQGMYFRIEADPV